jgi:16S rRNA (guanine527-N7)-methyltransferase
MKERLKEYFPDLSENQLNQYLQLAEIFPEWNSKVNCVSRKDIDNLFVNHILHSLSIAKYFKFPAGTKVADIGTGGGFPGIPLAIMFPNVKFDLVDSIGKKIMVVKDISERLELQNVEAINLRAEQLPDEYDFIVSRAVTAFPQFVSMVKSKIKYPTEHSMQGVIYLKGGEFENEIAGFCNTTIFDISEVFDYEYFTTKKIIYLPIIKKSQKKFLNKE